MGVLWGAVPIPVVSGLPWELTGAGCPRVPPGSAGRGGSAAERGAAGGALGVLVSGVSPQLAPWFRGSGCSWGLVTPGDCGTGWAR